jgi:uncharacterized integral membrane protein
MQLYSIFAILFVILGILFALQNTAPVTVSFMLWSFEGSLALVFVLAVLLGGLIASLAATPRVLRQQWQLFRLRRQVDKLEKDLAEARVITAQEDVAAAAPLPVRTALPHERTNALIESDSPG